MHSLPKWLRMEIQDKLVFLLKMCILGKFVIYHLHFLLGIYQVTSSFQSDFISLIFVCAQMGKLKQRTRTWLPPGS